MNAYACEIITPMFAHGADQSKFDLRASQIKGMLRFWFRTALASKGVHMESIKKVEDEIFGDTSHKSKIQLSVDAQNVKRTTNSLSGIKFQPPGLKFKINPYEYLAYGMYEKKMWKEYANRGKFEINVSFFLNRKKEDEELKKEEMKTLKKLMDSLMWIFSAFGGIGAKSRKGFGSFQIDGYDYTDVKKDLSKHIDIVYECARFFDENLKITGVSNNCPHFDLKDSRSFGSFNEKYDSPTNVMSWLGRNYYVFRRNLEKDGVFKFNYKNTDYKPKRAILGLPINYHLPKPALTLNNEATNNKNSKAGNIGRKASPLYFSIHKEDGGYFINYAFLPAKISPDGYLSVKGDRRPFKVKSWEDYDRLYKVFSKAFGRS